MRKWFSLIEKEKSLTNKELEMKDLEEEEYRKN